MRVLKNGHSRMKCADYTGMHMAMWPPIDPKWLAAFEFGMLRTEFSNGLSRYEKAIYHRCLAYSFGIKSKLEM